MNKETLKKLFGFSAYFLSAVSASLFAADVASVSFEQTSARQVSEQVLKHNVQTEKGMPYSDRILSDDIKRLYALGIFDDVTTDVKDRPDGKVDVVFRVTTRPVVNKIELVGNKKYTREKLMEFISVTAGMPLNDKNLRDSAEKLRKFYDDEGLKDSNVSAELTTEEDGGIKVTFKITENLRIRVMDITFEGATIYKDSELRDAMETRYSPLSVSWLAWLPMQPAGLYDKEAIERDKVRLRELYWRKGRLDFAVKDVVLTEHEGDPEKYDVKIVVDEGEPYFVGNVKLHGLTRFTEDEVLASSELKDECVYDSRKEDSDVNTMEEMYAPLGYTDFFVRTERTPDYSTHTVDIDYYVNEGIPYTINDIYISGNKKTKDYVIRREIVLFQGDPVDKNMIKITKNRLMGMGYFESDKSTGSTDGVDIVAVTSPENPRKKDIHINVQEKQFLTGSIGGGWSDTDGLAGMISIQHTNLDILDPENWFEGGGQKLRISALAGIRRYDIQADFTEPYLFNIPLRFDFSTYWRQSDYEDWSERRLGFKVSLTKRVFDDFTSVSGGYIFEYVKVVNVSDSYKYMDIENGDLVGKLFLSINRDTRNSATDPTSGYDIGAYGYLASKAFGGANNYAKVELHGINYYPFFHDWFVLSTGIKVGTLIPFGGTDTVPIYDRYFLGGGDSVRGFPYRSIGPVDDHNNTYGGQFMYLLTAELSHPIYSILRGAVFVDVGDVTENSFGPIRAPNIGVGYGLRIKIPQFNVPIRLDFAFPVLCSQENVGRSLRFHFNMGFAF